MWFYVIPLVSFSFVFSYLWSSLFLALNKFLKCVFMLYLWCRSLFVFSYLWSSSLFLALDNFFRCGFMLYFRSPSFFVFFFKLYVFMVIIVVTLCMGNLYIIATFLYSLSKEAHFVLHQLTRLFT